VNLVEEVRMEDLNLEEGDDEDEDEESSSDEE
jgi:hypothetical protein